MAGGAAILVAVGAFASNLPADVFGTGLAVAFMALVAGGAGFEKFTPVNVGLLGLLGDASYTIYLAHGHIEPVVAKWVERVAPREPDILFVATLTITVTVCLALHFAIEKPILKAFSRKPS